MKSKTSEERFIAATESIAKSLAALAEARKQDRKLTDEMAKLFMPILRQVARESTRSRPRAKR